MVVAFISEQSIRTITINTSWDIDSKAFSSFKGLSVWYLSGGEQDHGSKKSRFINISF
jgi:hypothetical protein